jgi:cytidine deaminase
MTRPRSRSRAAVRVRAELIEALAAAATRAREHAYAPYSHYRVGAAIATRSGNVYAGCNVENAAFPSGICAERGAIAAMVAAGERDPIACVIVTGGKVPAAPCGMCRQVLVEFARTMPVVLIGLDGRRKTQRELELADLMPEVFELKKPAKR